MLLILVPLLTIMNTINATTVIVNATQYQVFVVRARFVDGGCRAQDCDGLIIPPGGWIKRDTNCRTVGDLVVDVIVAGRPQLRASTWDGINGTAAFVVTESVQGNFAISYCPFISANRSYLINATRYRVDYAATSGTIFGACNPDRARLDVGNVATLALGSCLLKSARGDVIVIGCGNESTLVVPTNRWSGSAADTFFMFRAVSNSPSGLAFELVRL